MKSNIGLFVAKRAALQPNHEAIVDVASGKRLTYSALDARCNRLGNALVDGGLKAGDRVATLMLNSAEFVEIFFGGAKVGAAIVPLNWRLVADERFASVGI